LATLKIIACVGWGKAHVTSQQIAGILAQPEIATNIISFIFRSARIAG